MRIFIAILIFIPCFTFAYSGNTFVPNTLNAYNHLNEDIIVNNDIIIMFENHSIEMDIIINDYGYTSGIKSLKIITKPTKGSAEITNKNKLIYTPNLNFKGQDLLEYELCNNTGSCGKAFVFITVENYDFKPIAVDDHLKYVFYSMPVFDVLNNDLNLFDWPLSLTIISDFTNGLSTVTSDLKIQTHFNNKYSGEDMLIYRVCDADNDCSEAKLYVYPDEDATSIKIPQGFSPDGDGINDTFRIPGLEQTADVNITIVDRNGTAVYLNHKFENWDGIANIGSSKGKPLPTGVYYYVIKINGLKKDLSGYVYLSR